MKLTIDIVGDVSHISIETTGTEIATVTSPGAELHKRLMELTEPGCIYSPKLSEQGAKSGGKR